MAWGDHKRVETGIKEGFNKADDNLYNLRQNITRQNNGLENRFNVAADRGASDYDELMGNYRKFLGSAPSTSTTNFEALPGYRNFAENGGYSGQDIQDLRQRAIDPLRGVYSRAQSELNRNRALQGGYSPNFAAAQSQMARQLGHQVADTNVGVNASLADAVRQGKLAGLAGETDINKAQSAEGLANRGQQLSGMSGATSLFGASPGQAQTYGNQMLTSTGQTSNVENMQEQLARDRVQSLLGMSNVAGNFQSAMGNISSGLGVAGQVGGAISGLGAPTNLISRSIAPNWGSLPSGGSGISY